MYWYALFVETNKEEVVQQYLNKYFVESVLKAIIPKRLVPERREGSMQHISKKMFPGYVLISTELNENIYHLLKKIPRCYRILQPGNHFNKENAFDYCRIKDEEITPLIMLLGEGDTIEYSHIYIVNSKVFVNSGPLKGMEGIIKKIDKRKNRAKILLNFLGTEKTFDVGIEILKYSTPVH